MKPQPTDFELTQIWVQKYNSDHSVWKNLNVFHPLLMTLEVNGLAGLTKSAKRPAGSRNVPTCIQIRILDIEEILALLTEKSSTLRKKDNT